MHFFKKCLLKQPPVTDYLNTTLVCRPKELLDASNYHTAGCFMNNF